QHLRDDAWVKAGGAEPTAAAAPGGKNARRLEGPTADAPAVGTGDGNVEFLAEAGEGADRVEQGAFGLRQGLQGHRLAGAAQQALEDAEVQRADASRFLGADEFKDGLVGETEQQQRPSWQDLAEACAAVEGPVVALAG